MKYYLVYGVVETSTTKENVNRVIRAENIARAIMNFNNHYRQLNLETWSEVTKVFELVKVWSGNN